MGPDSNSRWRHAGTEPDLHNKSAPKISASRKVLRLQRRPCIRQAEGVLLPETSLGETPVPRKRQGKKIPGYGRKEPAVSVQILFGFQQTTEETSGGNKQAPTHLARISEEEKK